MYLKGFNNVKYLNRSYAYTAVLSIFLCLGLTSFKKSNNDSIHYHIKQTIKVLKETNTLSPDSIISISLKEIENAEKYGYVKEHAHLLRLLGLGYYDQGNYAQAFIHFNESHKKCVSIKDSVGIASAINNLAIVYSDMGYYEKALQLDLELLELSKTINDKELIADAYNNLAVDYFDNYNDKALEYYKKALNLYLNENISEGIDLVYNNIGGLFLEQEEYDSAQYYLYKNIYPKSTNNEYLTNTYRYLAEIEYAKNNFNKAILFLEKALALARETEIVYDIEYVAELLHLCYFEIGKFEKAYHMQQLYVAMKDSSKYEETAEIIAQVEAENTFKKEIELSETKQKNVILENQLKLHQQKQFKYIAIIIGCALLLLLLILYRNSRLIAKDNIKLQKQKQKIQLQRDKINELNKTKDKFMAIVAHDLRNPLGGVYKLSEGLETNYDILSEEKIKKYISNIRTTSDKVYELLENLLQWASIQRETLKKEDSEFNLTEVIEESVELLRGVSIEKNISIKYNSIKSNLVFADKTMIKTVVRNLLSNALKFTPTDGNISISIKDDDTFKKVSIKDDGVGISNHDQEIIFNLEKNSTTIGKSKESGVGLGLVLCKEFVELNGGQIGVKSKIKKGSTFFFTVPKSS